MAEFTGQTNSSQQTTVVKLVVNVPTITPGNAASPVEAASHYPTLPQCSLSPDCHSSTSAPASEQAKAKTDVGSGQTIKDVLGSLIMEGDAKGACRALWDALWLRSSFKKKAVWATALSCTVCLGAVGYRIAPQTGLQWLLEKTHPVYMTMVVPNPLPPFEPVCVEIGNLPEGLADVDLEISVDQQIKDASVSTIGPGKKQVLISGEMFSFAENRDRAHIEIRSKSNRFPVQIATVPLAKSPVPRIEYGPWVFPMVEGSAQIPDFAVAFLLARLDAQTSSQAIAVGTGGCTIHLPSEVVGQRRFTLELRSGGRATVLPTSHASVQLTDEHFMRGDDNPACPQERTYDRHWLTLRYRDRIIYRTAMIYYCAPLKTCDISLAKRTLWAIDSSRGVLRATADAGKNTKLPLTYHVLTLSDARIPFGPGRYVMDYFVRGMEPGAVSTPLGPWCDLVLPRGSGSNEIALKFSGDLANELPGQAPSADARGIQAAGCEERFPLGPGIDLYSDTWHRCTMLVEISPDGSNRYSFHAIVHIDGRAVAETKRSMARVIPWFRADVRNWSSPQLELKDYRLLFLPRSSQ